MEGQDQLNSSGNYSTEAPGDIRQHLGKNHPTVKTHSLEKKLAQSHEPFKEPSAALALCVKV
jgi:hypothetical protein